jgi:CheY-like chemotaxis protein
MRILVAEDEQDIRSRCYAILKGTGHEVTLASNGEECLDIYRQKLQRDLHHQNQQQKQKQQKYQYHHGGEAYPSSSSWFSFDVVVLDYRMPKKDGLEVAKEILKLNPSQRIIFASAYVKETLEKSVEELKMVVELLQKPFSMFALVDTVENGEVYEDLKIVINTAKDIIKDPENPSTDQIRELFEALRKMQKFGTTF